jgi:predicted phage terminase large subunit-like protein
VVAIEDKASGQSLLQELKRDTALPLHPMAVQGDKLVRAAVAEPTISAGRVLVPDDAPWVENSCAKCARFRRLLMMILSIV